MEEIFDPQDGGQSRKAFGNDDDMEAAFNSVETSLLALVIDLLLVTPCGYFSDRMQNLWRCTSLQSTPSLYICSGALFLVVVVEGVDGDLARGGMHATQLVTSLV